MCIDLYKCAKSQNAFVEGVTDVCQKEWKMKKEWNWQLGGMCCSKKKDVPERMD